MKYNRTIVIDLVVSILLLGFTLFYSIRYIDFSIPPFEDAAMLMRYSEHMAQGYGIVWNVGESPVDGATDFLFMVSSAALIEIGLPVGRAIRGIGFVSHFLTVILIYSANRLIWKADIFLSAFSALYLAVGTGLSYVAAYFGTPFFALAAAWTWTIGLISITREDQPLWLCLAFAISGLLTGLIRPEGVILAVLILIAVVTLRRLEKSKRIISVFAAVFIFLGGAYFLWRWDYFGYPLPNPFYKKGASGLHWDSYSSSLWNTLRLCLPFLAAYILGLRSSITSRQAQAFLIPIIGFAAAFVLISDETNYGARFQYALLPLVLLSWIPLVSGIWNFGRLLTVHKAKEIQEGISPDFRGNLLEAFKKIIVQRVNRESVVMAATLVSVSAGLIYYSWFQNCFLTSFQQTCLAAYESDGRYEMGKLLSNFRGKGYVLATTEAGLVPYYSGWTAIDTWGLNDQWIAHNGEITTGYLDQYKPHIISFHAYFSPLVPPKLTENNLAQDWFRMTITLKQYAEQNGYILAAVFGDSPYDTHYYYVRPDFDDSNAIAGQISRMSRYYWFTTGKKSINYAAFSKP